VIEIQELTKYYGERKAVGPLSFRIDAGEVVGLLGLNGAGKTTTLRMLSSDLLPTSGRILIDGTDLVQEPEKVQAKIGYLPDRPPLYPEMSVREYLTFAARVRGVPKRQTAERVEEVMALTNLTPEADERIGTLSHGYCQRVGIGQTVVHKPSLVLLDEPNSGLDPKQITEMRQLLRTLGGEHTVLISSHILPEISETCDRLLIIRDGEIGASGSEAELAAQMAGYRSIRLTLRLPAGDRDGGEERIGKVLAAVAEVESFELVPADEDGPGIVCVAVKAEADVREEICREMVGAGIGLRAVERGRSELENVFLQLTGMLGSPASPQTAA